MNEQVIKILVVEDEMLIGAKVSMFLSELGYEVTGILPRAEEVLNHIQENNPDIALLDIQLKGEMDGIALAQTLMQTHRIPVVFLTANSDDATFQRAKTAQPYAFLTKPFNKTDLQRALELTIARMAERGESLPEARAKPATDFILSDRIFIHHKDRMVKVLFEAIQYIEAERNYCRIVTQTKEFILSMPMKNLEDKLPDFFQRIHRSYIVNLKFLDEIDEFSVRINSATLPVSKSFKNDLLRKIRLA
ncbi:MAG: response regulator [Chitinophagales bacterium]|nr:response regulator [Chitinophagales bacterium]